MFDLTVKTSKGILHGIRDNGVLKYLGIPYAKPPVGELRFKRSVPPEPWDGIYEADHFGSAAVQFHEGEFKGSEDCLFLNVVRPEQGEKLPVLVWIHGGGYNTGGTDEPLAYGDCFARDGIVYVSIQYRMNVLGFYDFTSYPMCEDFDSNCGLSDQILALNWVHENISAFGGDPDRVTIAGESAGACSVINMLAAPGVKGCFRQAIVQSALVNCVMSHTMARRNISLYLEGMGWTEADIPGLKSMEPYEMLRGNEYVAVHHQYRNPGMFLPGPVIDDLLPVRPLDAIRAGSAKGIRLIIGTNRNEGTMFVHPENTGFPNSWEMVAEMLENNGHGNAFDRLKSFYLDHPSHPAETDPFVNFATDYAFQMPSLKAAEAQAAYAPVWMYRFEYSSPASREEKWFSSHAFDLPCIFCDKDFKFSRFVFGGDEDAVADNMIYTLHSPWVNFIKSGEPDPENWPNFVKDGSPVRIFDRVSRTERPDRSALLEAWGDMRFYED